MESLARAAAYVVAAGKAHHYLELSLAGGAVPRAKADLAAEVTAVQNDDGSFVGTGAKSELGSVPVTARRVELLARAEAAEAAKKGASWLAAMQRPDGGFSENPALAANLKPEWEWFSARNSVTWITGDAIVALSAVGGFNENTNRARSLLLRTRNKDGGWPGQIAKDYPDRTDLWAIPAVVSGLLAAGVAPNHDVFAGLPGAFARQKGRWRNPVENPLPALLALGRRAPDADVQECLKLLAETQNDDGGWPYVARDESHPDPTTALFVLLTKYRLSPPP
ncbi:MAG: hypothetical protein GTN49_11180 [candidate division Zixibacteria bacterium]|nr:hypothetical protein [candidate division Zixibacteria bacterium]